MKFSELSRIFLCLAFVSCARDFDYKTARSEGYVEVDRGQIYYQVFGKGDPIIVVHGGPGLDQTYLQPQLLDLAKNHQLIFYDQRGSGKSLKTEINSETINIKQFAQDLESVRKSLGLNKVALIGHSWGGTLSMQYATMYPEHISSLILVSSLPADYKGQKAFSDEFVARTKPIHNDIKALSVYEEFEKLNADQISTLYRKLFYVYFFEPSMESELTLNFDVLSARSGFKVSQEMKKTSIFQSKFNLFPELRKLHIPTFIIHGKKDIIPYWTAEEIHKTIPRSYLLGIEECDHFPYVEKPKEFFGAMEDFLNK